MSKNNVLIKIIFIIMKLTKKTKKYMFNNVHILNNIIQINKNHINALKNVQKIIQYIKLKNVFNIYQIINYLRKL